MIPIHVFIQSPKNMRGYIKPTYLSEVFRVRNIQWLSVLGSIGVGIAAYSMMNGRGQGQAQRLLSNVTNMGNQGR
jgi:hypothetical protein